MYSLYDKEHLQLVSRIYPEQDFKRFSLIQIPEDLKLLVLQLKNIVRFDDPRFNAPGTIPDNDLLHSYRLVFRAGTVKQHIKQPTTYSQEDLIRCSWIHDIPENLIGDVSAEARRLHLVPRENKTREQEAASKMFGGTDLELYREFMKADALFDEGSDIVPDNLATVIVKVIDRVDGNLVWHYWFTRRLREKYIWDGNVPPETTFTGREKHYQNFTSCLRLDRISKEVRRICMYLLDQGSLVSYNLWKKVPSNRIPEPMKYQLEVIRNRYEL